MVAVEQSTTHHTRKKLN